MAQTIKNLPAMQETWVRSLGQEDPLEKGMATHSSILAWRILWIEEPGGVQSMGHRESDRIERLTIIGMEAPEEQDLFRAVSLVPRTVLGTGKLLVNTC